LVRNANKGYPGLISYKYFADEEHWQCNYCFAQRLKPHTFRFGKGNPIEIHCTKSKAHADKEAVKEWCAKSADHFLPTLTNKELAFTQKSLHAFLQPSPMPPPLQPKNLFQTFDNRMSKIAANPRQVSASDRQHLDRARESGGCEER
jgi:hypothetical protein